MSRDPERLSAAARELEAMLGSAGPGLAPFAFDFTGYYADEMGSSLMKTIVSFKPPFAPDALRELKLLTNALERRTAGADGRRLLNVDPGYLTRAKVVLASTKNQSHRVALGRGIYAEITLQFRSGRYHPMPWTYEDYRSDHVLAFFGRTRLSLFATDAECGPRRS